MFFSTTPSKLSNVRTHSTMMSDHTFISAIYSEKSINIPQNMIKFRDNKLITKHLLSEYIANNQPLNDLFSYTDPDSIANTLVSELSNIIDIIAPPKIIQAKKKYAPWLDKNFKIQSEIKNLAHLKALRDNIPKDWRIFRAQRNLLNRLVKDLKTKYYAQRLNDNKKVDNNLTVKCTESQTVSKDGCIVSDSVTDDFNDSNIGTDKTMWKTVKNLTGTNKNQPPRMIVHNNEKVTSIKKNY